MIIVIYLISIFYIKNTSINIGIRISTHTGISSRKPLISSNKFKKVLISSKNHVKGLFLSKS